MAGQFTWRRASMGSGSLKRAIGVLTDRLITGSLVLAEQLAPLWLLKCGKLGDARLGRLGEAIAARHLRRRGLRLLSRRHPIGGVEVDLVLRESSVLVLAEVKTAWLPHRLPGSDPSLHLDPFEAPGRRFDRLRRLRLEAAARSLRRGGRSVRIDLVEVVVLGPGRNPACRWERDAQPR